MCAAHNKPSNVSHISDTLCGPNEAVVDLWPGRGSEDGNISLEPGRTSQPNQKLEAHLMDIDLNPHVFQCLHENDSSGCKSHQWEDETIKICGTTKGIATRDAKNDRVLKGKEVMQPTSISVSAQNHMSLINQTKINPSSLL